MAFGTLHCACGMSVSRNSLARASHERSKRHRYCTWRRLGTTKTDKRIWVCTLHGEKVYN